MIALDTDILIRFYVDDPGDPESAKQRPIAYKIFTTSLPSSLLLADLARRPEPGRLSTQWRALPSHRDLFRTRPRSHSAL